MNFVATKKPVGHGHASPPDSFLIAEIAWAKSEDNSVFAPNLKDDIYGYLRPVLAPNGWESPMHRKGAACEALRVIGGDESDWNFKEGRDTTAGTETPEEMEAGAFQISYDSCHLGAELRIFLGANGIYDAATFQARIKASPTLDFAYVMRVLRDSTRWDGPLNRGWVREQVSEPAMREFMALISA